MAEAPPQAGSGTGTEAQPPQIMTPPPTDAGDDTRRDPNDTAPIPVAAALDDPAGPTSAPVRFARFDQEHPEGTPDSGPIQGLTRLLAPEEGADDGTSARSGAPRRRFLLAGVLGVATAGTAGTVAVRTFLASNGSGAPASDSLKSAPSPTAAPKAPAQAAPGSALSLPDTLSTDLLLRRVTYGLTPGLAESVGRTGLQRWLVAQLDPASVKDPDGDAVAAHFPALGWSTEMLRSRLGPGDQTAMKDLGSAHVGRAIWSSRQLFEVLVDFWSNHLNVPNLRGDLWDTRHRYDADVIRRNALGSYEEMLAASATHPAMLTFLDGARSSGGDPNENYARELLEQHTVGVEGGYTERDVQRTALLFTGWKVDEGQAIYDPDSHAAGEVRIMGFAHPDATGAAGRAAQQAFLTYLATHPRTAATVARKVAVRFVSDQPPDSLVERLAQVYTAGGTQIVPMLRALFSSPELAESSGQKVRRPFERLASTVRALDVGVPKNPASLADLYFWLQASGHLPLAWPRADGYPDVAAAWLSPAAALEQFNTTSSLVHGWWPTTLGLPGPKRLLENPPRDRDAVIEAVGRRLLARPPSSSERSAARTLLTGTRLPGSFGEGSWEQEETIALVATLFLTSPTHLSR